MRVLSLLVLAPAFAKEDCDPWILDSEHLWDLSKQTYNLYYDMSTVVAQGLYREAANLAGPEKTKLAQKKVDEVLIMGNDAYAQGKTVVGPAVEKATAAAGDAYTSAMKLITPKFADLNKMLDKPMMQFVGALPAHAKLLKAGSLLDKAILLVWLVFTLTLGLRLIMLAFGWALWVIFLPCKLLCGRRAKAAPAPKKVFSGKSKATGNGNNEAKNPAPPKKR